MSLNWKEINLVLEELDLPGMQIQKVFQSSYDALAFQLYGASKSRLVLVCTSPLACRIHETFRAVPKSEKPLRFAELLKSRIVNSRIEEALQLGDNRIIRLSLRRGEGRFFLYIRLWSNAANVILTDTEGMILDAMKRLPRRGEISGGTYRPEISAEKSGAAKKSGTAEDTGTNAGTEKQRTPKHYEVRELPGGGSFNRRIDGWYAEHGAGPSLEQLREDIRRSLGKNRTRLEAALERLREKEADYANADRFREYGDIVLSSLPEPNGPVWIEAKRFTSGETIRIEMDRKKSAVQNAEAFYEKYRRAKKGLGELREEIASGEKELKRLAETEERLMEETNPLRLAGLLKKIRRGFTALSGEEGGQNKNACEAAAKRPGLSFDDGGWLILVGRDAKENDELLRRHVKGNDLWLHVRDWAGSYVFIKNRPGKSVPLEILLDAGNLALFYSKGRSNGKGDLYYTQVKYLRRAKKGPKGLVIPTQEKNLRITADGERLKRLETARMTRI